jgi:DNA-binding GntR family transcriptional regulator
MRVVPLSAKDMTEIYQVLSSLETMAVDLLARKKPSQDDLAPLQSALDTMEKALEVENVSAWAEADERFRRLLFEFCGNRRLADIANTVFDQVHRVRWLAHRLRSTLRQSTERNRMVVEAVLEGDWSAAREIHYNHRLEAAEVITQILEQDQFPEL